MFLLVRVESIKMSATGFVNNVAPNKIAGELSRESRGLLEKMKAPRRREDPKPVIDRPRLIDTRYNRVQVEGLFSWHSAKKMKRRGYGKVMKKKSEVWQLPR